MKTSRNNLWLSVTITGFLFTLSCAPAYVPNVVPTPQLGQQGEVVASFNYGIAGFDPQFAYAATDEIEIMANFSFRDYTSDSTENFHHHLFGELGGGYYMKIGEIGRFEVFGGGGAGKVKARFDNPFFNSFADVYYVRGFVQPSIGLVTKVAELSFTPRIVFVNMMQEDQSAFSPFIEPVVTGKVGYRYAKVLAQVGLSLPLGESELQFFYQPFIFSLGLQIRLDDLNL